MNRLVPLALACVLAACRAENAVPSLAPASAPDPATPNGPSGMLADADIVGEWRLVDMNGKAAADQPLNDEIPAVITMTVGPSTLRARSQCIGFSHRYTRPAQTLSLANFGPVAMCARSLTPWEAEFGRTLAAATEARVADGRLILRGPEGQLMFERAAKPADVDLTGRWALSSLHGQRPPEGAEPIRLEITADELRLRSGCVTARWRYWQSSGNMEVRPHDVGPVCERTRTALETEVIKLLDGVTIGVRLDARTIVLDGGLNQAEFKRID